jgi:hypothetical protein
VHIIVAAVFVVIATVPGSLAHAQHKHAAANERGAKVMGFDQEKTAHHFHLYTDGGTIDVRARDARDTTSIDAIRSHLPHIAMMFGQGNFEAPMLVHQTDVPGTSQMSRLKDRLTFTYRVTPQGGRVDITTEDADALAAVHAFLRFQIRDHKTGDATEVKRRE